MNGSPDGASPARDELRLPDYDHLPLGSLAHRIRTLDADALGTLLEYERAHGNRLPVTELMGTRLDELRSGAEPSGGSPRGATPEKIPGPEVPQETNQTAVAPTINPPAHGDPTNPAQPR
jgi:hypothetical protein